VALAFQQARALLRSLAGHPGDDESAAVEFDDWCHSHVRPWFVDHERCDSDRLRRWAGGDVDLSTALPSDLVVAAAAVDPTMRAVVAPYEQMRASPASLDVLQPRARAVYATGWRPPTAAGPTRDEIAELCQELTGAGQWATGQPCPV
jgi:hypothetical protein